MARVDGALSLILRHACDSQCEDPRDRIFGVLGMLPSQYTWLRDITIIDYTLSLDAVYSNCARQIIQHDKSLEILRQCEYSPDSQPTWAPHWNSLKTVAASPGYATALSPAVVHSIHDSILTVSRLVVSRISRTLVVNPSDSPLQVHAEVNNLKTFFAQLFATDHFSSQAIMMERFVAVLINHNSPKEVWNQATNMWPSSNAREMYMHTLIRILNTSIEELFDLRHRDPWAKTVLNTFYTIRGCAAINTEGDLLIGPADMVEGDIVAVLVGLDNPIVLRPTTDHTYQVIGVCSMPCVDAGQALLGDFVGDWEFVKIYETDMSFHRAFKNWRTGKVTLLDPRVHWQELAVDEDDPRCAGWLKCHGWGLYRTPDAEYFERHGIEFERLQLI